MWMDARSELHETVGDRLGEVPYLLGEWRSRKDVRTEQLLDGPKEKWKPDMEVLKAIYSSVSRKDRQVDLSARD
jgi:hypothetical protein